MFNCIYLARLFLQPSYVPALKFCAHGIPVDASVKLILGSECGVAVGT
jgi:hypothetical protein